METLHPLPLFLRSCARIDLDEVEQGRLMAVAETVRDWKMLGVEAEDHGLSPLVRRHVRRCGDAEPRAARNCLLCERVNR